MKKRRKSLLALMLLGVVALVSAGSVWAFFNANAQLSGINVSVANSGLLVNGEEEWNADVEFSDIYPGWISEDIPLSITNTSDGDFGMQVDARALLTGTGFESLADSMEMLMESSDYPELDDYKTLNAWADNAQILSGGDMFPGEVRDYVIRFRLPEETTNEIQNTSLGLNVLLTGSQI